ncbi:hypothetical protein CWN29_20640 [Klebsiella pneumoniae]|uniref:hypothetical protein n=1 Tax=Klebsiella pneumoniae TaxID=573 RepID=UPI000C7DFFC6|nr:hypothetical protein [Klebsiella pneumoniae]PLM52937.1 hypothetical protein CWN29_20640 [Klebsiella pneumoniae]
MMNPVPWLQMTNMISYQGLVRTFPNDQIAMLKEISQKQSAQIDLLIALAHKKEEPEKDYLEEARKKAGLI